MKRKTAITKFCLLFSVLFAIILTQPMLSQQIKTIRVPNDIKVEENAVKEIEIRNLSDEEIFRCPCIYICRDFIYLASFQTPKIVKMDLKGKTLQQAVKIGIGPGEYRFCGGIRPYKDNIALQASIARKIIVFNHQLKLLREFKVKKEGYNFYVNSGNEFVLFNYSTAAYNFYFMLYDEKGNLLRSFGKTKYAPAEKMRKNIFDLVHDIALTKNGIWACFRNRYDLRYYEHEKFKVEIKEKKKFFTYIEKEALGSKYLSYTDRALCLARAKNSLLYFYTKDNRVFVDIFDLMSNRLLSRYRLNGDFRVIGHYKENIFYAAGYSGEDEEVFLYRLELPLLFNRRN